MRNVILATPLLTLSLLACAPGPETGMPAARESALPEPDPYSLAAATNYLTGPAARPENGMVNVVIEIPAGTVDKWEVGDDGVMRWEFKNGEPRIVRYLGYPANYGMIPRTLLPEAMGGDGDPLDVILVGPAVERGSVVKARVLGVLKMLDGGEIDDKLIAVQEGTVFAEAQDLDSLDRLFPGATMILETWFTSYKGAGVMESRGFQGIDDAEKIIAAAIDAFETARGEEAKEAA